MDRTIGQNISKLRQRLAWTQEHLAGVTGLSVRTVQRIEDGASPSAESLMALASAFGVSVDDLRMTPEQQSDLEAQAAELLKKAEERYSIIPLERVERASSLTRSLPGVDSILCEYVELTNDNEEDAVAALDGFVRDFFDLWSEMGATVRRDTERDLQEMIEGLGALGLIVAIGTHSRRLRFMNGKGDPFDMTTLYIMVSRAKDPKLFIALDKKAPVRLA
jgi:transcriptional regulator with XRE-family HTH domain